MEQFDCYKILCLGYKDHKDSTHKNLTRKHIEIGNAYSFNYTRPIKLHCILHMKIMGALFPNTSSRIFFKLLEDLSDQFAPRGFHEKAEV